MSKKVFVDVSARHIHLRAADIEALFGPGAALTPRGQESRMGDAIVVYKERLEIVGPKGSIKNVSILGPRRSYLQVEVSLTDARALGLKPPVRESGKVAGSAGCKIIGPCGALEVEEGVIVAWRHLHLNEADAQEMGISNGDIVSANIEGTGRSLTFGDMLVRTHPNVVTTIHIDTDEANAAGISGPVYAEIIK